MNINTNYGIYSVDKYQYSMIQIILIQKTGRLVNKRVKTIGGEYAYKYCNYTSDKNFEHVHTYDANGYEYEVYGKVEGRANSENKVFYNENGQKKEIHPFWLRERVDGDQYVDSITKQRLFDPTQLKENVEVSKLNLSKNFLEVIFKDGVTTKIAIEKIFKVRKINLQIAKKNKL